MPRLDAKVLEGAHHVLQLPLTLVPSTCTLEYLRSSQTPDIGLPGLGAGHKRSDQETVAIHRCSDTHTICLRLEQSRTSEYSLDVYTG